jgi:hypothetical protein
MRTSRAHRAPALKAKRASTMRRVLLVATAAVSLAACTTHTWAPPPGGSPVSYEQQAAQCRMFARGSAPSGGFVAATGRPAFVGAFVGAAVLAQAINSAVVTQANFNDCMFASGWIAVDQAQAAVAAPATTGDPWVVNTTPPRERYATVKTLIQGDQH